MRCDPPPSPSFTLFLGFFKKTLVVPPLFLGDGTLWVLLLSCPPCSLLDLMNTFFSLVVLFFIICILRHTLSSVHHHTIPPYPKMCVRQML